MDMLPTPIPTAFALHQLHTGGFEQDRIRRALLGSMDGHRNVIQLESFARAMGLEPDAIERLRLEGLIEWQPWHRE